MQAGVQRPSRPPQGARVLTLVLSLLLALTPLPSLAETLPLPGQAGAGMPCHDTAATTGAEATSETCPHCSEGAPASQCHCCSGTGPAGAAIFYVSTHSALKSGETDMLALAAALCCAPVERRFRPPIHPG